MRSGAGTFCPRSRRLECLLDFFTRDLLPAEAEDLAGLRVAFPAAFAGADGVDDAAPAVRISAKLAVIDVRSLIQPRLFLIARTSIPRTLRLDNRTIVGFPLVRHQARTP